MTVCPGCSREPPVCRETPVFIFDRFPSPPGEHALAMLTQAQPGQLSLLQTAGQHSGTGLIAGYDPRNDTSPAPRPPTSARGLQLAGEVVRWPITGKGMLTYSPSAKVLEESATPGLQCTFALGSFKNGQIGELEETPGLAPGPGRCSRCRAAMSRPSRTGPARRRRSTRAICRRKPTGAPSSAGCGWRAGFSLHPR